MSVLVSMNTCYYRFLVFNLRNKYEFPITAHVDGSFSLQHIDPLTDQMSVLCDDNDPNKKNINNFQNSLTWKKASLFCKALHDFAWRRFTSQVALSGSDQISTAIHLLWRLHNNERFNSILCSKSKASQREWIFRFYFLHSWPLRSCWQKWSEANAVSTNPWGGRFQLYA